MRALERTRHLGWRHVSCALIAAFVGACANDLVFDLEGKLCRDSDPPCVRGFHCDGDNLCVPDDEAAGAAGTAPSAGAGGSGSGRGGRGGNNAGAAAGAAGAGGAGEVGDAAAPGGGGDAGCTPVMLYEDRDDDQVGDTTRRMMGCPTPGWVEQSGDCRDDLNAVHPGQLSYFGESYPDPVESAGVSYDYDCSDNEEPDPTNNPPSTPPMGGCTGLLTCTGAGYLPATPARSGMGVEPRCGSNLRRTCISPAALTCQNEDVPVADRFRCK